MLAGGIILQLFFHIAIKTDRLSPKSAMRWRKIHICFGYLLIAAFISHSDFSLPDTGFEWALWAAFVLVTLSGILGTYLAWSLQAKRGIDERVRYDRIPTRRAELERDLYAAVAETDPAAAPIALPAHCAWAAGPRRPSAPAARPPAIRSIRPCRPTAAGSGRSAAAATAAAVAR